MGVQERLVGGCVLELGSGKTRSLSRLCEVVEGVIVNLVDILALGVNINNPAKEFRTRPLPTWPLETTSRGT